MENTWYFKGIKKHHHGKNPDISKGVKRRHHGKYLIFQRRQKAPSLMCLAKGHNAVTPVRLEPATHQSRVKHFNVLHSYPIFIWLTCSIPVVNMYFQVVWKTVWICQKPDDLDLQCFKKQINSGSAGQGLRSCATQFSEKSLLIS